mmetsp:Transcript_28720/g.80858  ORF Transcript_28720/g.80858 Transcript_28720/m.80858 type:complete len:207 (-) Transcript_28720:1730-2350(-)
MAKDYVSRPSAVVWHDWQRDDGLLLKVLRVCQVHCDGDILQDLLRNCVCAVELHNHMVLEDVLHTCHDVFSVFLCELLRLAAVEQLAESSGLRNGRQLALHVCLGLLLLDRLWRSCLSSLALGGWAHRKRHLPRNSRQVKGFISGVCTVALEGGLQILEWQVHVIPDAGGASCQTLELVQVESGAVADLVVVIVEGATEEGHHPGS